MENNFDMVENACEDYPGWAKIIREIHAKLYYLDEDYAIEQIKEKFGGLRYYYFIQGDNKDPIVDEIANDVVIEGERKSYNCCEVCGDFGWPRSNGWVKTLCDEHADGRPAIIKYY